MPKYFCEHCNKKINEKRKIHFKSDFHKKAKESYYSSFHCPITTGLTSWSYTQSLESHQFNTFLHSFLKSLYKPLSKPSNPNSN